MKNSIIKEIFHGNKGHMETMGTLDGIQKGSSVVCDAYDEFVAKLSPELLPLFKKLLDAVEDNWSEQVDFYFVEGFKLGIQIGIECSDL